MGKFALIVCLLVLGGAAASYPAWSQAIGPLSSSIALQPSDQTTATRSNSTSQAVTENTTEPDIFSLPTVTEVQNSTTGVPFGPEWVSQFVGAVDGYRGAPLTECASLDSFAMTRFETMTSGTNWEITHYGYAQDQGKAFGGSPGFYGEEYFYPTEPYLRTPDGFATLVKDTAPAHWTDLTSAGFKYYGAYFTGQGPILLFQSDCGPLEMGAGVNQTAAYSGCPYQKVVGPWLVIELSSVCPQ